MRSKFDLRILLFIFISGLWILLIPAPLPAQSSTDQQHDSFEKRLQTLSVEEKIIVLGNESTRLRESDPEKSLTLARQAQKIAETTKNPILKANALNYLGNWYLVHNHFHDALSSYLAALKFEPHIKEKKRVADFLNNAGIVYWRMGSFDQAFLYHNRAMDIRKNLESDKKRMAFTLNNLGLAVFGRKEYARAMDFYSRALALYREADYARGIAAALNNIGNCHNNRKNYREALKIYQETLPLYEKAGLKWGIANTNLNLAGVYIELKQYGDAEEALLNAMKVTEELNAKDLKQIYYVNLSHLHESRGQFKLALDYKKESDQLKSELVNEKNSARIASLQVKFDAEAKDNVIRLLKKNKEFDRLLMISLVVAVLFAFGIVAVLLNLARTRKRTNRLLGLSEAKYKALYSQAGDAIFLVDNATFVDCNQKTLEIFGTTREQIVGKSFADLSPGRQPDGSLSYQKGLALLEKTKREGPQQFYWQHFNKHQEPMDTTVSISPINVNGKQLLQAIVHDISHHTKLENERAKSGKLESIGLLAGGIAHDLNNLLAILRGYIDLIGLAPKSGKTHTYLEKMGDVIHSATELSGKFLTFSDASYPPKMDIALQSHIQQAVQESAGNIKYEIQPAPDLKKVQCDPAQIRQVIKHLVRNSCDALRDKESGKIMVSAGNFTLEQDQVPTLKQGQYVAISIRDNGEGIPEKNLTKIFDPYFSTRQQFSKKGQGMGLAVAHSIIRRHEGTVTVTSEPDRRPGTTMTIYLPASQSS